jgi:hypothetical protein
MLQKKKKKKERKKKFPIVKRNRRSKKLAHRLVSIRKAQQEVCISHTSKKNNGHSCASNLQHHFDRDIYDVYLTPSLHHSMLEASREVTNK